MQPAIGQGRIGILTRMGRHEVRAYKKTDGTTVVGHQRSGSSHGGEAVPEEQLRQARAAAASCEQQPLTGTGAVPAAEAISRHLTPEGQKFCDDHLERSAGESEVSKFAISGADDSIEQYSVESLLDLLNAAAGDDEDMNSLASEIESSSENFTDSTAALDNMDSRIDEYYREQMQFRASDDCTEYRNAEYRAWGIVQEELAAAIGEHGLLEQDRRFLEAALRERKLRLRAARLGMHAGPAAPAQRATSGRLTWRIQGI